MNRRISSERKTAFYIGTGISALGLLLFLSVFVTSALNFGNFDDFESRAGNSALRAVIGMVLMIAGQAIRAVGARGVAGSGLKLDPDQARDDVRPYTNAVGGMIRDALESAEQETDSERQEKTEPPPSQVILIRCDQCRKLNEETDKFCSECGASLL